MSELIVELKSCGAEDFLSSQTLDCTDETVKEIFEMMFGLDITAVEPLSSCAIVSEPNDRTAIVGFSGSMRGSCQIRIGAPAAQAIASAMLAGAAVDESDDSINDAMGELCNMLAGGWKNGIPHLSSECALSPPTVVSGLDYKIHMSKPSVKLCRTYRFGAHSLHLTLSREENGPK